jgi:long-chain acyl-CoA synthetase
MTSTIGEILPVAAQRFGARTALLVGDHSFSFDDLQALSDRAANGLVDAGRVALYRPNCWEWLVAYYGIAKTGAVLIPVNVMLTPDEVRYVVEDSDTRAVIASADKGEPLLDLRGTGNSKTSCCGAPRSRPGRPRLPTGSHRGDRSSVRSSGTAATWRPFATRRGRPATRRARCNRTAP